jgi:hypothetical protein
MEWRQALTKVATPAILRNPNTYAAKFSWKTRKKLCIPASSSYPSDHDLKQEFDTLSGPTLAPLNPAMATHHETFHRRLQQVNNQFGRYETYPAFSYSSPRASPGPSSRARSSKVRNTKRKVEEQRRLKAVKELGARLALSQAYGNLQYRTLAINSALEYEWTQLQPNNITTNESVKHKLHHNKIDVLISTIQMLTDLNQLVLDQNEFIRQLGYGYQALTFASRLSFAGSSKGGC